MRHAKPVPPIYIELIMLGFLSMIFAQSALAEDDARNISERDATQSQVTKGEKLFALHVKPLFAAKCLACHGEDPEGELHGEFDMRSRDSMLKGGESFGDEVLVPGQGEDSYLYVVTTRSEQGFEMPPKEADRLSQAQSWFIRDWINEGAPWPDDQRVTQIQNKYAEGVVVKTAGGLADDWTNRRYKTEDLWAYRPLQVESVPESEYPVDWFINRSLKTKSLTAAADANPLQLARRLSFVLTGLPPDPDRAREFADAFQRDAGAAVLVYGRELMASPHYGEHFGSHWLDVARYADTAGFANDYARPNAWRYRDYVVRAFNEDTRYDEFVRAQIAGDQLDPKDPENLIAVGFLRMGAWEQTGMSVFRVTRQLWLDDVTDSVGQTFLAHPLQCAKCHDHKFDPIPTRDYYSMMAVFSTTQFAERNAKLLDQENKNGFDAVDEWTNAKIAAYQKQQRSLESRVAEGRQREKKSLQQGRAKVGDNGLDPGDEASLARISKNIDRHKIELDKTLPIALSVYDGLTIERKNVKGRVFMPKDPWNPKAKSYMEVDTILTGGDAFTRGESVVPAPLSAAANLGEMTPAKFPGDQGSRRLALANWIVDAKNPLTARVMVNRVWSWHFGQGLAPNPNNFGATGGHPTHPALLDYLADWFVKHDWSVKKLSELIITSEAFRRSSRHPKHELLQAKDPAHKSYATFLPRRLTAEELRDAMLASSGELNRQIGGVPCRPEINLEVAKQPRQIMGGAASVYEPDRLPKQRNRRTLYAEKIRGLRDPFLELFNQPGADKSCELRETSTVTPQALTLFNSEKVHQRALAFADRLMKVDGLDQEKIQLAFELAFGRPASAREVAACVQHWERATQEEQGKTYQDREFPSETMRTVMAEKTGEPYDFVEVMPAYERYVSDLQPSQVTAKTRGLAQVCLVIFNSNEFAYLD